MEMVQHSRPAIKNLDTEQYRYEGKTRRILAPNKRQSMKENTGNVEPTALPKEDLDGDPFPVPSPPVPASKEDEAAALVTPNTPQVIPPHD